MRKQKTRSDRKYGVTLLELVTVVLIIGILSTIATNVYVGQVLRAQKAATQNTLRELGVAIVRYEIDTGELPLSGSGTVSFISGSAPTIASRTPPANVNLNGRAGSGFLLLSLTRSLTGDIHEPWPVSWNGPYVDFGQDALITRDVNGVTLAPGQQQFADSWGFPIEYVQYQEYDQTVPLAMIHNIDLTGLTAVDVRGTQRFAGAVPVSALNNVPANDPYFTTETYFNARTFQLWSPGKDGQTYTGSTTADDPGIDHQGLMEGDVNNF